MSLESRVAKLERQVRLFRVTLVGAFLVVVILTTAGLVQQQDVQDVVRAKRFELRTDQGQRVGWWGVVGTIPTLALFGSDPTFPATALSVTDAGGVLELYRKHRPASDSERFDGVILGTTSLVMSPRPGEHVLLGRDLTTNEFKLYLRDSSGMAVLGRTSLRDPRTGATTQHPITTLTFLDAQGRARYQVP